MSDEVKVRCGKCGNGQHVSFGQCLRKGWPKCCGGTTMALVSDVPRETIDKAVAAIAAPGCEYYDIEEGLRFHFPDNDDEEGCLCTFPYKDCERLDAERVRSLAVLGAAVVLGRRGEFDPLKRDVVFPSDVPQWIRDEIDRHLGRATRPTGGEPGR